MPTATVALGEAVLSMESMVPPASVGRKPPAAAQFQELKKLHEVRAQIKDMEARKVCVCSVISAAPSH